MPVGVLLVMIISVKRLRALYMKGFFAKRAFIRSCTSTVIIYNLAVPADLFLVRLNQLMDISICQKPVFCFLIVQIVSIYSTKLASNYCQVFLVFLTNDCPLIKAVATNFLNVLKGILTLSFLILQ